MLYEVITDDPIGGGRHEMHFVNCCKNGGKPASSFDYAGPFNEMVVMGNLAVRMQSLQKTLLVITSYSIHYTKLYESNVMFTFHNEKIPVF